MKQLGNVLFSRITGVILMCVFAVSIGWATFIENDYGTDTAKKLVYVAPWFEVLLWFIAINLLGNMVKEKLFSSKKKTVLLFHLAFLLILLGGAVTRYFGYEGIMHIREGASSDVIQLNQTYLTIEASYKGITNATSKKVRLTKRGSNHFTETLEIGGREVKVETELYLPAATEKLVEVPGGKPVVSLFIMDYRKGGHEYDLSQGDKIVVDDKTYSFDGNAPGAVTFRFYNGMMEFISNDTITMSSMMKNESSSLPPDNFYGVKERTIYRVSGHVFVVKSYMASAEKSIVSSEDGESGTQGLVVMASTDNASKRVSLINNNGTAVPKQITLDDIDVSISFGAIEKQLPFAVELKDFVLERYPGSHSPSSFASEVVVHDKAHNTTFPYRIFMNNILNYNGFRFFQSSYDRDQRGTILSVNHDFWGTFITYIGYFLMALGMILTLFNKNSRIRFLIRRSSEIRQMKRNASAVIIAALLGAASVLNPADAQANTVTKSEHIAALNQMPVQARNGRIEPLVTLSSEIMRKIHKKESYAGMSATEVVLGMLSNPERWKKEPIIRLSNSALAADIGLASNYVSFEQMFDNGGYKLSKLVEDANHKSQNKRNKYDKEIINLDERVNICYQLFSGVFIKMFPVPGDENHSWASAHTYPSKNLVQDVVSPAMLYHKYISATSNADKSGDWSEAGQLLGQIRQFQSDYGKEVMPSAFKMKTEMLYSKLNIFRLLSRVYETFGLLLLIFSLIDIFKPGFVFRYLNMSGILISGLLFVVYSAGLAVRWYISGHAPWSNGYETMVFVGWATALAGLIFSRQSFITLAVTNLLAGIILMVAGFSWMNPEITPLVPVLKSYWLIIHVAIITSSYGFLAIGALLGFLNLCLIVFKNKSNADRIHLNIKEITLITEITLIIGVLLLTIGAFLGGVWANESWGRYWGWDPKETWALITILVYSVVIHLNRLPFFKSEAVFNGLALLSISSVLMTFFGVNYYLSGMHSYAQGDAPPVPDAVYYASAIVMAVIALAVYREKRFRVAG